MQTDDTLMAEVQGGNLGTMALLFERHHKPLFRYFVRLTGRRELSEDLVQDTFFRILKFRHTYQTASPFKAWMYQIARNAHIDFQRKQKPETMLPDDTGALEAPFTLFALPDEQIRQSQEVSYLRRALAALPADKREILLMARFQELKYEEIAKILDCHVGAVKTRVHRALKELAEHFHALTETKGIKQ